MVKASQCEAFFVILLLQIPNYEKINLRPGHGCAFIRLRRRNKKNDR
jgi:hypothetical protein